MSVEQPGIIPRCRYCREDAFCVLQGWRHGPPDQPNGSQPDAAIPTCLVHRPTAVLKLGSMGFPRPVEVEVGTIYPGR